MPEPYKDMAPILDMFTALIRSPKVAQILKNWKESLRKGMLHFGTKERLNPELTFNLLTPEATLCIPKEIDPDMEANAAKYIHEIARHCALWLLTSQAVAKV